MKKIAHVLTAFGLFTATAAVADDKMETTKTHETDGKKTTSTRKVKHQKDAAGNAEVKHENSSKTELSTPSGNGGEKTEVVRTHETDAKKTTQSKKVTHKADADGNEVKTEVTRKTEFKK